MLRNRKNTDVESKLIAEVAKSDTWKTVTFTFFEIAQTNLLDFCPPGLLCRELQKSDVCASVVVVVRTQIA